MWSLAQTWTSNDWKWSRPGWGLEKGKKLGNLFMYLQLSCTYKPLLLGEARPEAGWGDLWHWWQSEENSHQEFGPENLGEPSHGLRLLKVFSDPKEDFWKETESQEARGTCQDQIWKGDELRPNCQGSHRNFLIVNRTGQSYRRRVEAQLFLLMRHYFSIPVIFSPQL